MFNATYLKEEGKRVRFTSIIKFKTKTKTEGWNE